MLLWPKFGDDRHPIINLRTGRGEGDGRKKRRQEQERKKKREDERESDRRDGGGRKEREQPAAAAPTAGLINLMVSVDGEGLSKDGGQAGRRGEERRGGTLQ